MAQSRIDCWVPGREKQLSRLATGIPFAQAMLGINTQTSINHIEMTEFPIADPWSQLMQQATRRLAEAGGCDYKTLLGLGIGDGRNERIAANIVNSRGAHLEGIIGVDIDSRKLALALKNLHNDNFDGLLKKGSIRLYEGDATTFLNSWNNHQDKPFSGVAFMCLPQTKGMGTSSDVVNADESHKPFEQDWDKYGLSLNAATLSSLRNIASDEATTLLVLSGRLPEKIRKKLINDTGWQINDSINGRVKQDKDTPLDWMLELKDMDDGTLFYDEQGQSLPITEAINRHNQGLPIYHDVYVYQIQPK